VGTGEGLMQPMNTLEKKYPKLAKWIIAELPKVRNNGKVWAAFVSYSQLKDKARYAVMPHYYPYIDYKVMIGLGLFKGSKDPNTIYLAKSFCERFESKDWKLPKMHRLMEATLLHELVHWGDWQDGKDQDDEEGELFELAAYGEVLPKYW
jgi:Metallopeptidase toxin 3